MAHLLRTVLLLLLVATLAGCTTCKELGRTVFWEPSHFNPKTDAVKSRKLYKGWAIEAWAEVGQTSADCTSLAFHEGFVEGFVEYTYGGGSGEPPPVAPREYWNVEWRADQSGTAEQWFAGYRLGAMVARDGGYRQRALASWSGIGSCNTGCPTASGPSEIVFPSAIEAEPVEAPVIEMEPVPMPGPVNPQSSDDSLQYPSTALPQPFTFDPAEIAVSIDVPAKTAVPALKLPAPVDETPLAQPQAVEATYNSPVTAIAPEPNSPATPMTPAPNSSATPRKSESTDTHIRSDPQQEITISVENKKLPALVKLPDTGAVIRLAVPEDFTQEGPRWPSTNNPFENRASPLPSLPEYQSPAQ